VPNGFQVLKKKKKKQAPKAAERERSKAAMRGVFVGGAGPLAIILSKCGGREKQN